PSPGRARFDVLPKFANLVDSSIARSIDFEHIHVFTGSNTLTDFTGIAGSRRWALNAVERFGQDASSRCLADATSSCEEIGMGNPIAFQGVNQGFRYGFLANQVGELLRAIATGKDSIDFGREARRTFVRSSDSSLAPGHVRGFDSRP